MNPRNFKASLNYTNDLRMLWKSGDVQLLKHILRDDDLQHRRSDFLLQLAIESPLHRLDLSFRRSFIEQVFEEDEDERDWFEQLMIAVARPV